MVSAVSLCSVPYFHRFFSIIIQCSFAIVVIGIGTGTVVSADEGFLVWEKTPIPTAVAKGDDLILACEVRHFDQRNDRSSSPLIYSWMKDGGPIIRKASMFSNHSLFVPRIGDEDFGQYMCSVTADAWDGETSASAIVIEAYLAPFVIQPQSQLITTGQQIALSCVTGQSAPNLEVFWVKDGERFNDGIQLTAAFGDFDPERLRVQTSMRLDVIASSATAGLYQCVARNKLLKTLVFSQSANISLETVPSGLLPVIEWDLPETLVIAEGRDLTLGCRSQVSTEPVQSVWYIGRHLVDESKRVYILPNGSLTFHPVRASGDKGSYRCQATNSKGSTWSPAVELVIAYLDIQFKKEPSHTFALYGQNVMLQCQPPDSLPKASVTWYKNFKIFDTSTRPGAVVINNDLHILSLTRADNGQYYCVAVNELTEPSSRTSRVVRLTLEGPPQMTQPPVRTRLVKNSLLHLTCLAESDPEPIVTWAFEGKPLTTQDVTIINKGQELWIPNVGKSWEGEFTCNCSNKYGSITASADVVVIVPPVSLHPLGQLTITSGSPLTIPCPVDGSPIPSVQWFHNGSQIALRDTKTEGQLKWKVNPTFVLTIDHVTPKYSGIYKCVASNEGGNVSSSGSLVVYVPPYFVEVPHDITKIIGQPGVLTCRAGGNEFATIHWLFNDTLDARGQLSPDNSTLTFAAVGWEHVGTYTCVATNNVGTKNTQASVAVLVPPRILATKQPENPIKIDTRFTLSCSADGIPTPEIKWTHQGSPLSPSLNGRVRFPTRVLLVIESALEEDTGIYQCVAESTTGSVNQSLSVVIFGRPLPPNLLTAVPLSSSSVYLLWEWTDNRHGGTAQMIDSFKIFYRKKSSEDVEMYPDVYPPNVTRVEVTGLDAGVPYVFYVNAINEAGISDASNALTAFTFHSAPEVPTNLRVLDLNATSAKVIWEPPTIANGVVKRYQLRYKRDGVNRAFETINITSPTFPTQEVVLHSLRPHVKYTIQSRAATLHEGKELWGNYSLPLDVQTKMALPSLAPQSVNAKTVDANSITVEWESIPELGRNGPITAYVVVCLDDDNVMIATHRVGKLATKYIVHGLSPWRKYLFVVKGENAVGEGPGSEAVDAQTLPIAPVTVPQEFTAQPLSSSAISLSWKPLPKESLTCDVTSYQIRFKRQMGDDSWHTIAVPSNTTVFVIRNLHYWSQYSTSVAAFTNTVSPGLGPHTELLVVGTLQGVSTPVTSISFTSHPMSVLLSWKPPMNVKGNLIGYSITYHPVNQERLLKNIMLSANSTTTIITKTLSSLSSSATYNITITARNGAGEGEATVLLVKTLSPPPSTTEVMITTNLATGNMTSTGTASNNSLLQNGEQNHVKKNLASIVAGSIIGAIALIIFLIFLCAQCKKYRKKQRLSYVIDSQEVFGEQGIDGQDSGSCDRTEADQTNTTSNTSIEDNYTVSHTFTTTANSTTTTITSADVKMIISNADEGSTLKSKKGQNDITGQCITSSSMTTTGDEAVTTNGKDQKNSQASSSGLRRFSKPSLPLQQGYAKLEEDGGGSPLPEHRDTMPIPGLKTVASDSSIEGMSAKSAEDSISIMSTDTLKRRSRMKSENAAAIAIMRNSQIITTNDSDNLIDNDVHSEVIFNERTPL